MILENILNFVKHKLPIKYSKKTGRILYKYVFATKINLEDDIAGEFSLEFLNNLPEYYKIQIGNTLYHKRVQEFLFDFLNTSEDFETNLEDIALDEIWIYK